MAEAVYSDDDREAELDTEFGALAVSLDDPEAVSDIAFGVQATPQPQEHVASNQQVRLTD